MQDSHYIDLIKKAEARVQNLMDPTQFPDLLYHNLAHTRYVVNAAVKMALHYQLEDDKFFTVIIACWFHDVGYYLGSAEEHEKLSAQFAANFLADQQVAPAIIEKVQACIIATQIPQHPQSLEEEIICDADMFHLGSVEFVTINKALRKERDALANTKTDKDVWHQSSVVFLRQHHYFTSFCAALQNEQKELNIAELQGKQRAEKETKKDKSSRDKEFKDDRKTTEVIAKPAKHEDKPQKVIETMFRIAAGNHQRLSGMADNKAHILITTTSIIISLLLSILLRKLEDHPQFIIPTIILLTVCVTTMVCCILATRPSIPNGKFTEDQLQGKQVNLLFFGNFFKMGYTVYENAMMELMTDNTQLYKCLIRDLYGQGAVLGKKYRLLRTGYSVFMFGMVLSVFAYSCAALYAYYFPITASIVAPLK